MKFIMRSAPRIELLILEYQQTHKQLHMCYVSSVSLVLFELRNFPFRICGSTVVKIFQTSFNFETIKNKALLYDENDLSHRMHLNCFLVNFLVR